MPSQSRLAPCQLSHRESQEKPEKPNPHEIAHRAERAGASRAEEKVVIKKFVKEIKQ